MAGPTTELHTPHLGVRSWTGEESPLEGKVRHLPLEGCQVGGSAAVAGSMFRNGIVRGKKMYFEAVC